MSIIKVSAKLDRTDSQTPWGFRMAGGKDYYSPLIIQKVNPGSLSSKCGIRENDTITHIGGCDVSHLTHKDAQDLIIGSGNNLELKLERSSGTSHNSGNDGYFQQHQSLPWQQQPYKPTTGMIGLAPKPFQKPGAVTTITSHMSNFNIGVAPATTTQDTEQTVVVSGNDTEEKAPPLDNNPMPTSTGDIIKMGDDGLTNENCSSKEYELSSCQLKEDTLISAENVTKSLIGGDQLDITSSDENNKKSDRNLADRSDATNVLPESRRTFAGPDSEDRPRSRSFRRLQGLLQEEDISEEGHNLPWSSDDIIVKAPSQRKTITINKSRVESPLSSQSVTAAAVAEVIVQSAERKQIIVKSNSVGRSAPLAGQSSGIDVNGNKNLLESSAPIGPGDIIYGSEKTKIVLKKREQTNERKDNMDFTLEDLGLTDAVVVGISLPGRAKECLPTADVDVVESRSQITVLPKPTQTAHQSFGAPTQHHSSGTVVWRPQIPAGERKMKIGRPGQAQKRPPMAGTRIPICTSCHTSIRGPFVTALDKTWCPEHFVCANPNCSQPLFDCGFVEEADQLYCEKDYEKYLAPRCARCSGAIVGEVVNAMKNTYHLQCFVCTACHQPIGTGSFHNEDGKIYCAKDWGALFQTKCYGCQFPIEPGDRWVEALSQNWHSECFNCSTCQINLEGQSFCAKNGKPYCKKHGAARRF